MAGAEKRSASPSNLIASAYLAERKKTTCHVTVSRSSDGYLKWSTTEEHLRVGSSRRIDHPAPQVRDLTTESNRQIALATPTAKGTAVLAIVTDVRPMPQTTHADVALVPDVTYAQAYTFGERVDAFYWIAEKEKPFDQLRSAERKPKGGGCSAGGCGPVRCLSMHLLY